MKKIIKVNSAKKLAAAKKSLTELMDNNAVEKLARLYALNFCLKLEHEKSAYNVETFLIPNSHDFIEKLAIFDSGLENFIKKSSISLEYEKNKSSESVFLNITAKENWNRLCLCAAPNLESKGRVACFNNIRSERCAKDAGELYAQIKNWMKPAER